MLSNPSKMSQITENLQYATLILPLWLYYQAKGSHTHIKYWYTTGYWLLNGANNQVVHQIINLSSLGLQNFLLFLLITLVLHLFHNTFLNLKYFYPWMELKHISVTKLNILNYKRLCPCVCLSCPVMLFHNLSTSAVTDINI